MALFLQRASRLWTPGVYSVGATLPNGVPVKSIRVSVTREMWPEGPVGKATLKFPDGNLAAYTFSGGDAFARDGSLLPASTAEFFVEQGKTFPPGAYELMFEVLQAVFASVKVERF